MTSRPHRVLAVVVGAIVLVAIVVAIASATRSAPEYDAGTPEWTVQTYLTAVMDGDTSGAAELLSEDSRCEAEDYDLAYTPEDVRVVLRDTETEGDTALVKVDVVFSDGGPFAGSEYSEDHTFRLARAADGWLITGSPWPLYECFEGD